MAEGHAAELDRFREGDLLRREQVFLIADKIEICAVVSAVACHGGEDVALVVAVQAERAGFLQECERFLRGWAEIHLIAQGDDPVRAVPPDRPEHAFQRREIAVYVCDERDLHGCLLLDGN